jgi:hypothetical protein
MILECYNGNMFRSLPRPSFGQRTYLKGTISAHLMVPFTYMRWPEYGLKKDRNMLPLKDTNIIYYFCGPGGINSLLYRISYYSQGLYTIG